MEEPPTLTVAKPPTADEDAPSSQQTGFPVVVDSRFEFLRNLGQGGYGKICLAYDQKLQRNVALKFLITSNLKTSQMLLQEARAQAQIKHENICQIYEVLESDNHVYLVMQFIDGESLNAIAYRFNLEQKLVIMEKILRGLQYAHHQGIIHRDIKPSNILVETTNQGDIKPYLIDFGLAHRTQATEQTTDDETGLGTPSYMAPEQRLHSSSEIDRRADIYSAGATLYRILTGKIPTQLSDTGSRLFTEAHSLSKSNINSIPADIKSLITKCLQENPSDRYESAKILADDIHLYLSGEPIQFHYDFAYKLKKKLRKHKWVAALAALVFLTVSFSASWTAYQYYQQQIREVMIQRFTAQVENLEARVRFTHMAPRHDITSERAEWRKEIDSIKAEIDKADADDLIYGPGHYAVGRMHYAFQEYNKALKHLTLAWDSGFQQSRVAYVLSQTHGALYQQQKTIIYNLTSQSEREDRMEALDKLHRLPAVQYLEQGISDSAYQSYARAQLYYYQGELENALETLEKANNLPSWFYHHKVLEGDIHLNLMERAINAKEETQFNSNFMLAMEFYKSAIDIAPNDFQLTLKPTRGMMAQLRYHLYNKMGNFHADYLKTEKYINEANLIIPQSQYAFYYKGQLLSLKAAFEIQFSGDPVETYSAAIEHFQKAIAIDPENTDILRDLASASTQKLNILQSQNKIEGHEFEKIEKIYSKVPPHERDYFYYITLGVLLRDKAIYNSKKGEYTDLSFHHAIVAFSKANDLRSERLGAILNEASVYRYWSDYLPVAESKSKLLQAISQYKKAELIKPNNFVANLYLGSCYLRLAKIQTILQNDNSEQFQKAEQYLQKALIINPNHPFTLNIFSMLIHDRAIKQWQNGLPYTDLLNDAIKKLNTILARFPDNHTLLATRADIFSSWLLLDYLSGSNTSELQHNTHNAIQSSLLVSEYNRNTYLLYKYLSRQSISLNEIESLLEKTDLTWLVYALWYSDKKDYTQAEKYFEKIQLLHPALVWKFKHIHLKHWLSNSPDDKLKFSLEKNIEDVKQKLMVYYPSLTVKN